MLRVACCVLRVACCVLRVACRVVRGLWVAGSGLRVKCCCVVYHYVCCVLCVRVHCSRAQHPCRLCSGRDGSASGLRSYFMHRPQGVNDRPAPDRRCTEGHPFGSHRRFCWRVVQPAIGTSLSVPPLGVRVRSAVFFFVFSFFNGSQHSRWHRILRQQELQLLDLVMLQGGTRPTIAVLHEDSRHRRHVRTYEVSVEVRPLCSHHHHPSTHPSQRTAFMSTSCVGLCAVVPQCAVVYATFYVNASLVLTGGVV